MEPKTSPEPVTKPSPAADASPQKPQEAVAGKEPQSPATTQQPSVLSGAAAAQAASVYDLKAPSGVEVDPDTLGVYGKAAQSAGIELTAAQKMLETIAPRLAEQQAQQMTKTREEWRNSIQADPEVGGVKFKDSLETAGQVLSKYGSESLRSWFDKTGLGDNPELFKLIVKFGNAIREDKITSGRAPAENREKTLGEIFYPNMK